ncbi:MAG TPA: PQQ-binding-like beta-propeller repeat protein, partial [Ilumatobacteraceae bacterium]|nr:PQQ-binding-like beta-propeller repeat protein [Ilumatobacteraceae bacterium]
TGKLLWTFHVVPQAGESGAETWGDESWKYAGDLGAWNPLSADDELGYVYVPLTAPTSAAYGGWRPGDNLYSNALVALDAKTGRRVWHFQMVHHDLWEYDNVGPPTLADLTVDGRKIKAVIQPNKNGFLYVLDRANGKPVWPITERPVPQSNVPGEITSPTQPFPSKPPAFDRQGFTEDDLIDFTPELRAQAREVAKQYVLGPIYTPPTMSSPDGTKGTLMSPGAWGAANWHTGAFDPETGMYYAVSHTLAAPIGVMPTEGVADATMPYQWAFTRPAPGTTPPAGTVRGLGPQIQGLPIWKPPYGRITAYNMNKGEIAWQIANGDTPPAVKNNPALKGLNIPKTGSPSQAGLLVTKTLLFAGEGSGGLAFFHAYDKATGAEIWQTPTPGPQTSVPMTYLHQGRQYVVVGVRGPTGSGAQLIAYAIPREEPAGRGGRGGRAGGAGGRGGANPEN